MNKVNAFVVVALVQGLNMAVTVADDLSGYLADPLFWEVVAGRGILATPKSGTAPLSVEFKRLGASWRKNYGPTYEWDFGDGQTSMELMPQHGYTGPGRYKVSLRKIGQRGAHGGAVSQKLIVVKTGKNTPTE